MKRIIVVLLSVLVTAMSVQAQTIKFLGKEIDGPKSEMEKHLKAKGFVLTEGAFRGEFNGRDSYIFLHTNRNILDRVMVTYADYVDESQIKINFNNLISQFQKNQKYKEIEPNKPLGEKEDISYEMLVHKKNYDAIFYPIDATDGAVWFRIVEQYGRYYIAIFYDNLANQADGSDL